MEDELRVCRPTGDFAWDNILNGNLDRTTEDAWRLLFDEQHFLEHRQFSPIHKIVLGLVSVDLETHLKLSTSDINSQDSSGRTALSWAASRGDILSMQILLNHGAKQDVVGSTKASPLQYAAKAENPAGLQILLDAGGNFNARNYRGRTPLHIAASYHDGARHLAPLINAGADVNAEEASEHETPIIWACDRDNAENMAFLLDCGATLELPRSKNTALRAAVVNKAYNCLSVVLHHGPDYKRTYANGDTILHIIASKADQRMLNILANEATVSGLDTAAQNDDGNSAADIFQKRFDSSPSLVESFQRLLNSIHAEDSH